MGKLGLYGALDNQKLLRLFGGLQQAKTDADGPHAVAEYVINRLIQIRGFITKRDHKVVGAWRDISEKVPAHDVRGTQTGQLRLPKVVVFDDAIQSHCHYSEAGLIVFGGAGGAQSRKQAGLVEGEVYC